MFAIRTPKNAWDLIQSGSGKNKIFSSGFMWLIGIIASTLFAAGINGGPILMVAPLWVIYIFVNSIFYFGSWASYSKFLSNMLYEDLIGAFIQGYFLPWFHLSTG